MTYHEQRRQAEDLLRRNYTVSQIAQELKLQTRTVQRWAKELREGKPEPKATPIVKAEVLPPQTPQTTEPALLGYGGSLQDWVKDYNSLTQELKQEHRDIRIALKQKLLNELAQDGSNRAIHTLSLAIQRHGAEELRMLSQGRGDLLTISQAFALIQSAGYSISQVREDEQDDPVSDQPLDTEATGESGQEHRTTES